MRMTKLAVLLILPFVVGLVIPSLLYSGDASVEQGKKLFADPGLGGSTNGSSCDSCHPNGKGLENAGGNKNLSSMVNRCIAGPLKGTALDDNSVELQSLMMYIKSVGK